MATMIKIATVTVGSGGAATIDFSSIPATYTDLKLVMSLRADANVTDLRMNFNGLATNQSQRALRGSGSTAESYIWTNLWAQLNASTYTANAFSNGEIYILNYSGANFKSFSTDDVTETNAAQAFAYLTAGLWSSTAVINQITLTPYSGNFVEFSSATLYGIKSS